MATIAENLLTLNETKQAIKIAIEEKGQDLTNIPFTKYAEKIIQIAAAGDVTVDGYRYTKGTVVFTEANAKQIVTHNLGVIPSFVFMYPKDQTVIPASNSEEAKGTAWYFGYVNYKEGNIEIFYDYQGNTNTGALSYTMTGGNAQASIDAVSFTTGALNLNYKFQPNIEFEWIAVEWDKYQPENDVTDSFMLTLLNRPTTSEVELTIPNGIKYLGYYLLSNWYHKNSKGGLVSLDFNEVETIHSGVCSGNNRLTSIQAPNLKTLTYDCFYNCAFEEVYFPNVETASDTNTFRNCVKLKKAVFDKLTTLAGNNFAACSVFDTLIIKTPSVCTLTAVFSSNTTCIANGTASIYVPDNLVEEYKAATNWATYADMIKPLSEYENSEAQQ